MRPGAGPARRIGIAVLAAGLAAAISPAFAQADGERKAFKVCQDPNNLPFSDEKGQGIENKLAELFAKDLGLPVTYYSFPNRLAFIRNTLRYKLPGEDFRCDIVMSVPAGFDQVSATQAYYRSTYALVFPKSGPLASLNQPNELFALPAEQLKKLRIGLYDKSPGSEWLAKHELVDQGVPYPILNPNPEQYPGEIIERDLATGKLDAAIVWGPIAGYYAKRVRSPELRVLPLVSEKGVKFDYAMAMGVRYGEPEWKKQIEGLITKHQAAIQAILNDFGVPLLELPPPTASR